MPNKGQKIGKYRNKNDMDYPDLPSGDEKNRLHKQFNSRLSQPLIDRLSEAWKHTGYETRNAWLEDVLTEAVEKIEKSLKDENRL